jgi:hypothetical protein
MEENGILNFFSRHWSKLFLALLAVACLGIWTERFFKSSWQENREDYLVAQKIFERFQKGEFLERESLDAAEQILQRHPEMHPKYDSLLALTFFAQHHPSQAIDYAKSSIDRVSGQLPEFYKEYAETTLLIAEEDYGKAWEKALELDQKIVGHAHYAILDGMNKLRLCFLADRLKDSLNKKAYWQLLSHHPSFPIIESVFHEGKLTLVDYFNRPLYGAI